MLSFCIHSLITDEQNKQIVIKRLTKKSKYEKRYSNIDYKLL